MMASYATLLSNEPAVLERQVHVLQERELEYKQALRDLRQHADMNASLNEILQLSLSELPLVDLLDKILVIMLDISWLALGRKGSIFLVGDEPEVLNMVVEYNLGPELQYMCNQVRFGNCLCGLAAQNEELVFRSCVNSEHHNRPKGMEPHGHYCVPIKGRHDLLGVLNLYVNIDHKTDVVEQDFLTSAAQTIAGIIERKKMEEKLKEQSYEDVLTGLPNKRCFYDNLAQALARAKRADAPIALFHVDMEGVEKVRGEFGDEASDTLLQASAGRISTCLRATDTLARAGMNEFLVLLEPTGSNEEISDAARRLWEEMSKPFNIFGHVVQLKISIGISIYPQNGESTEALLKHADYQMYAQKLGKKG